MGVIESAGSTWAFWLLAAFPLGFFALVMFYSVKDDIPTSEGPEVDADGEAGPPPPA